MRVESASALTPPEMFLSRLARVASSRASSSSHRPRVDSWVTSRGPPSARRRLRLLPPRRARVALRALSPPPPTYRPANVPGDSGVANPGLDAARLLIRGEGVSSPIFPARSSKLASPPNRPAVVLAHPQLVTDYSLVDEIQPRVNYLRFLHDNDRLGGESVAGCILADAIPRASVRRRARDAVTSSSINPGASASIPPEDGPGRPGSRRNTREI